MDSGVFQSGQTDEFQANLAAVGELQKIRIGVEEVTSDSEWRLKQVKFFYNEFCYLLFIFSHFLSF